MPTEIALGIHHDTQFKLGLQAPRPGVMALEVGDFLTGAIPKYPDNADYLKDVQYGNYQNDRYGVCGPVSVANSRRMVTSYLKGQMAAPTQADVFDLYRRSGNPNFDPATGEDDNGVIMLRMLQALVAGGIGGEKPVAFARVNIAKLGELDMCIAVFGAVLFGVNLQSAQQQQTNQGVWDYSPSGPWGGHAVMGGAFPKDDGNDVITWGRRVRMRDRFIQQQGSEAWVVVWKEHLSQKQFYDGLDVWKLADAFEAISGKPFPRDLLPPKPKPGPIVPTTDTWSVTISGKGPKPTIITTVAEPLTDDFEDIAVPPLET